MRQKKKVHTTDGWIPPGSKPLRKQNTITTCCCCNKIQSNVTPYFSETTVKETGRAGIHNKKCPLLFTSEHSFGGSSTAFIRCNGRKGYRAAPVNHGSKRVYPYDSWRKKGHTLIFHGKKEYTRIIHDQTLHTVISHGQKKQGIPLSFMGKKEDTLIIFMDKVGYTPIIQRQKKGIPLLYSCAIKVIAI